MMAENNDMLGEHSTTYRGFVRFVTMSTIAIAVALGLMALFLL